MATVEQNLAKKLKDDGVLRLPVDVDGLHSDTSRKMAARNRMARITKWVRRGNVDIHFEEIDGKSFVTATIET